MADGAELGSAVHDYPHAVLEQVLPASGRPLPSEWALQVPEDYREVLRVAVPAALRAAGVDPSRVIGIATDFTACTVLPVTQDGVPLNELPAFADRPHAYVKLWKHHAAQPQASRITELARERGEAWLPRYGGLISSEWQFAKALQVLQEDPEVYAAMRYWVEAADWVVWQLCGSYVRNTCTARLQGDPPGRAPPGRGLLPRPRPRLRDLRRRQARAPLGRLGDAAGTLTAEAARWTGLARGDRRGRRQRRRARLRARRPGRRAGQMVAIMGTSTCHVMNGSELHEVPGMCGSSTAASSRGCSATRRASRGSATSSAGSSTARPRGVRGPGRAEGRSVHEMLYDLAAQQEPGEHGLVALDWHSGNRSPLVDHHLTGVLVGLTLATRPEDVYRASSRPRPTAPG